MHLDDFEFCRGDKFFYEYNFFENHIVDIRVETITEENNSDLSIRCIQGNGISGITTSDIHDAEYALLRAITHITPETRMKELLPFVEALRDTKFNRKQINDCLKCELEMQS